MGIYRKSQNDFISVADYGAIGNGIVDDLLAIQAAINAAANIGIKTVRFPAGVFLISGPIYLYYDAALNPGYPADNSRQGRIRLTGDGTCDEKSTITTGGFYLGTTIKCSSATSSVVIAESAVAPWEIRNITIEHIAFEANTTNYVLRFDGAHSQLKLNSVTVLNTNNAGHGIQTSNIWLSSFYDVYVWSTNNLGTGIGWRLDNPGIAAGQITFHNCSVSGWKGVGGIGYRIGNAVYGVGSLLNNVALYSCQASQCDTGIQVLGGMNSVSLHNAHLEGNGTNSVEIYNYARSVNFYGGYFVVPSATGIGIKLGNSTLAGAAREWRNVSIENCSFNGYTGTAVKVDFSGRGLLLSNNKFSGTGVGVDFGTALSKHGMTVISNVNLCATQWLNRDNVELMVGDSTVNFGVTVTHQMKTSNTIPTSLYTPTVRGNVERLSSGAPVTINEIAIPADGSPIMYLAFASVNVTIANAGAVTTGALCRLAGGVNFAGSPRDTLTIYYDRIVGEWIELSRSVN